MAAWLKLWIEPSLDGPIRTAMTPAERSVYYELQLLAKKFAQGGLIAAESGKPYSKNWIAARLNVNPKVVSKTVQKGVEIGLINDTEKGLYLIHFKESQSDYYRQKPYRQKNKTASSRYDGTTMEEVDLQKKYMRGEITHAQYISQRDDLVIKKEGS